MTATQRTGKFRFTVITNPLSHKMARTMALEGKRLGLQVVLDHDGAWFDRTNLIVAEGAEDKVRLYMAYYNRAVENWS